MEHSVDLLVRLSSTLLDSGVAAVCVVGVLLLVRWVQIRLGHKAGQDEPHIHIS